MKKQKEKKTVQYLSIIYIGMGTSWLVGTKDIDTAVECVKMMKQDWGHLFKFKKNDAYPVHLYKLGSDGCWESFHGTIQNPNTKKPLQFHKTFWVVK